MRRESAGTDASAHPHPQVNDHQTDVRQVQKVQMADQPFPKEDVNFIFLFFGGKVDGGKCRGVVVAPLLGKGEYDARETFFLPQHLDNRHVNVLFLPRISATLAWIKMTMAGQFENIF